MDKAYTLIEEMKKIHGDDYKVKTFNFKANMENLKEREFEGYASTWDKDDGGEIIEKGSFTKTLKENIGRIKVLFNHHSDSLIGKPLILKEDEKGLYVKAKISKTRLGNDILELLRDGAITEMSIGYIPVKYDLGRDEDDFTVRIKELKLFDVSPVTWGMNSQTLILAVKDKGIETKEGRVLSGKNRGILKTCIESLSDSINTLNAVLEASEPTKATPEKSTEPANIEDDPSLRQSLQQFDKNLKEITEAIKNGK